jgi:hypothetical protein
MGPFVLFGYGQGITGRTTECMSQLVTHRKDDSRRF